MQCVKGVNLNEYSRIVTYMEGVLWISPCVLGIHGDHILLDM